MLLLDQFKLTRGLFVDSISSIPKHLMDLQLSGLRNTIHWHIGHVLVITEEVANFPNRNKSRLPECYQALFGRGTKPSDWPQVVPDIDQLIVDLQDQLIRIEHLSPEQVKERLTEPFDGMDCFEEFASLVLFHEAFHLGQILTMQQVLGEEH
ncbi:DinB family protein [Gracilibacillus sp. HCP3S3_G5_1]|uniref:DinB family protein n=1 Tax=unclassified Gracilibacillus TaxID=2625209 RepID=UPI003F8B7DA7